MFASQQKGEVTVDGVAVQIRKLSARSLEKAQEARQAVVAKLFSSIDLSKVSRPEEAKQPDPKAQQEARYGSYDRSTVLHQGIMSWSATRDLTPDAVDDLEEEAADKIYRAILDLSLKPIGFDKNEAEKNDSGLSISY